MTKSIILRFLLYIPTAIVAFLLHLLAVLQLYLQMAVDCTSPLLDRFVVYSPVLLLLTEGFTWLFYFLKKDETPTFKAKLLKYLHLKVIVSTIVVVLSFFYLKATRSYDPFLSPRTQPEMVKTEPIPTDEELKQKRIQLMHRKIEGMMWYDSTQTFSLYLQKVQTLNDSFPDLKEEYYTLKELSQGEDMPHLLRYKKFSASATEYLINPPAKSTFLSHFYYKIIPFQVAKGNLRKAIKLYERLQKDYAPDPNNQHYVDFESKVAIVKTAQKSIQALENQKLAPDVFLFRKAEILSYLFGDVYYWTEAYQYQDTQVAKDLYAQLIKEYPESELADDAQFAMNGICSIPYEGGGGPDDVDAACVLYWEEWLTQHPTASVKPKVYENLCTSYYAMAEATQDKSGKQTALEKSNYYSQRLKEEFYEVWKKNRALEGILKK